MQHTAESPILVIGATGRHGGTGATVVDCLLRRGHSVRALIRTDDERAGELRRRGAETVVGDLHDRGSLVPAFDRVRAVYFTYPVAPGIIPAAANVASVLSKHASAAHIVVMSMAVSALDSPSKLGQAQAVAEDIFIWAGLNPTVLRFAGLFHENIAVLHQRTIQRDAVIANSFGGCEAPWISGDDAAEIAAAHLLTPRPDSPRISYPPPAEAISHTELARIISAAAGRPVRYEHISAAAWQRQLELAAESEHPVNVGMAQHIATVGAALSRRSKPLVAPDPSALAVMLDRPPASVADFIRRNHSHFATDRP
ncbi:NmrA family NAD(P)-binding protein [Mycobacterium asiaticum]|uniref:NmrA family NAD(P)-binding protein n=1 Tax=Mycobacterium asiaticum TaxID=1790 RepID=UPI0005671F3B|nr:NmrA family NAD(P)-binding protein [Mycobacterium asiaticum]ORA17503.1 hypothetical protein BST16_04250 [Mycobacterium asiaticum DSM 44297]